MKEIRRIFRGIQFHRIDLSKIDLSKGGGDFHYVRAVNHNIVTITHGRVLSKLDSAPEEDKQGLQEKEEEFWEEVLETNDLLPDYLKEDHEREHKEPSDS